MTERELLYAVSAAEDRWLLDAEEALKLASPAPTRKRKTLRHTLLLAAVLATLMTATAYAAGLPGIRSLFHTATGGLPEGAEALIEPQDAAAWGDGWSARLTESLSDGSAVLATIAVSGGERYILAPTDASPRDPLWTIGREGEGTLGEYAAAQGKTLLFVGASLPPELWSSLGQSTEHLSDGEMLILIDAQRAAPGERIETACTVYARADGAESVERLTLPFTLTEGQARPVGSFIPKDADAIPGLRLGAAELIETPLGWRVSWPVEVTDEEAFYEILKLDFAELTDLRGGFEQREDGGWQAELYMGRGSVGDTLTARFYDWDKKEIGEVILRKGA